MIQTLLLLCVQIFSCVASIYNIKKKSTGTFCFFNIKLSLLILFLFGFVMPLFEEALFRVVFKEYLKEYEYGYYINAVVFGLLHAQNYFAFNNLYMTVIQVFGTTYLGYYLVQLNTFTQQFITHMLYNLGIMIPCTLYQYYLSKTFKPILYQSFSGNDFFCYERTVDDMLTLKNKFGIEKKVVTNKKKKIQEMYNQLSELYTKRPY